MFRLIYWIVNTCNECAGYELVLIQSLGPLLCPQDPLLCPQGPLLSGVRLLQTNVNGWSGTNLHHRIAGFDDIILQTNVVGACTTEFATLVHIGHGSKVTFARLVRTQQCTLHIGMSQPVTHVIDSDVMS